MQTRIAQIDAETGELFEGAALALVFPKRRNGFREGWVAMAQNPMLELAKAGLGEQALRVFLGIVGTLDFENYLAFSQSDLAERIGMKRQHVSRAFARLVAEGVVLEGPKVGRNRTYRLDPSYGWKGSAKGHHEALGERVKASRQKARQLGLELVHGGQQDAATVEGLPEPSGAS